MNAPTLLHPAPPRPRIAAVLTRDMETGVARSAIIARMLEDLARDHEVVTFRLHSLLELRSPRQIAAAFITALGALIRGRPVPLQCLLYGAREECARVATQIHQGDFMTVYLDTVRCLEVLRQLRRRAPEAAIVSDFDDLLSRRMGFLASHGMPMLTGHTAASFPGWLRRLVEGPLARLITRYEAATLPRAEIEAVGGSSAVVLISSHEKPILAAQLSPHQGAKLHVVPPPVSLRAMPWQDDAPLRFVFIGTDRVLQNRLAIDHLLDHWTQSRPGADLHIYGAQSRPSRVLAEIHWQGFVEDLAEVYRPGSILICPALITGGIKTKVTEAWSFGCPVLGNQTAFEGLPLAGYPLLRPEDAWGPLLADPEAHRTLWREAATMGHDLVLRHLSPRQFHQRWADVIASAQAQLMARNRAAETASTAPPPR